MFLRNEHGLDQGGGANALSFGHALAPARQPGFTERLRDRFPDLELAPDLGSNIGSREWFRGAATCVALCTLTVLLGPGFSRPIYTATSSPLHGVAWDDAQDQAIKPLALGATTGKHMAATKLVSPLSSTPERPIIELSAVLGRGDDLAAALRRTGVGKSDATQAATLIGDNIDVKDLTAGTRLDVTLGRRAAKSDPRPLEKLSFRARFDLAMEVVRGDTGLSVKRIPIAIDHTPLRIEGTVGSSLYRSARAAGAPADAVAAYIKAIASRVPMSNIDSDDKYTLIIQRERAETGEVQLGKLQYAGLQHDGKNLGMLRWNNGGDSSWFDSTGTGETKGRMIMPIHGRITSTFGWRMHPILHRRRMHDGLDIAAPYGTPIRAAVSGTVAFAGRKGGYGNFVMLRHSGGLTTGYGHMKKIAVRAGAHVRQGQVIGYEGSTGLSTGAHLHFETRINGRPVNPLSISLSTVERLSGSELRKFRQQMTRLLAVPVSGNKEETPADAD